MRRGWPIDFHQRLVIYRTELTTKQGQPGFSADAETPLLEPAIHPITLEMLPTHSSGIIYQFANPHVARWCEKFDTPPAEGDCRSVEEVFNYSLAFQPGAGWMYGPWLDS